jgi:formylglycine-generating enzyme required for sulfatase activity
MLCPNCGSENSNERRFCFNCGRAFVSARVETAGAESTTTPAPAAERNEFLDSLSGRNEFIDSLSGRNQFLDSLSGYRIDGANSSVETIFVPSSEDERGVRAGGNAVNRVFEDEEADDVFEQSLSGLKISEAELEDVEDTDTDDASEPQNVEAIDQETPKLPEQILAVEPELSEPFSYDVEHVKDTADSRRRRTGWRSFGRVSVAVLYGVASFAIGSAVTMQAFDLPQEIPSVTDLPVMAAAAESNTPPDGMAFVPGGEFRMGSDEGDAFSRPEHLVTVGPFFIDQTEVTNEAYLRFAKATGHEAPQTWPDGKFPAGEERLPVTGVTWYDAAEYAAWRGKRLPTESEWEFAARGSDGRIYPWGNDWAAPLANAEKTAKGARQVGQGGRSPFGIYDMAGNVWEWTASDAKGFSGGKQIPWSRLRLKIIRGGNWQSDKHSATTFFRGFYGASGEKDYKGTGFRCVKDIPTQN